jgi:hypothetical protein
MAFGTAAGYGNLPSGNFAPQIFSQKVLKFFRRASVAEDITNTDYTGEIENFGDTVNIIKEPTITVSSYTRGSVVNTQNLADDQITLTVDQANAFAFKIDDIEERHSHVNFEALATSSGAFSLKRKYDANVLQTLSDGAGNKIAEVQVTGDASSNLRNGLATPGTLAGFTCYKSTALNSTSGTDQVTMTGLATDASENIILAGHISAAATASHIAKTEVVRSTESFSDVVRGLHVFGRKVLRPEALVRGVIDFA